MYGSLWSISKYDDIMDVETRYQEFSSEAALDGVATDPPKHTNQRRVVRSTFTPTKRHAMAAEICERVRLILDDLPRNEVFDWVDLVSMKVTTAACHPVRVSLRGAAQAYLLVRRHHDGCEWRRFF